MDYHLAVSKIYTNTDYNKACFNFTEEEAREKKLWRDVRPMPSLSELEAALVEASKDLSITNLWDDTVSEIYIQMRAVFGTGSDAAVIADVVTFEAMAKRPGNYVGVSGLIDEAAVLAYAEGKLAEADAYAVFRLNKLAKFKSDKIKALA